jgi:bacterioferritin
MDKAKVIDKFNEAISLELAGLLQYNQYSQVLTGHERLVWHEFFEDQSKESLAHARLFGSRVVALGGTPSVEPDAIKQTTDLHEMLENSLQLERRAVKVYTEALALCEDHAGYRNLVEGQIDQETQDVEELEKLMGRIEKVATAAAPKRQAKSA